VRKACAELRKHFPFQEILATGSLASGNFHRHSDIDLIIKGLPADEFFKAYARLYRLLPAGHDLDLKPYEDLDPGFRDGLDRKGIRIE
jgi:predicted nucleotidyltransferase